MINTELPYPSSFDKYLQMRLICCVLLLFLLPACASSSSKLYTGSYQEIQKEKEAEEDRNFFYGGWLPQKSSPQKQEPSQF